MNKITVAGSGVLGSQIAFQTAFHGFQVTIYDISETVLAKVPDTLAKIGEAVRRDMHASEDQINQAIANIRVSSDLKDALDDADLMIEAIPEQVAIKIDFYSKAGPLAPAKTIFASNSSTLLPSQFAQSTGRPSQFLMMHFANEIWTRNTAEIMGHAGTDPEVFDAVVAFAQSIGMIALPIHKEQPGYITNSLLVPWVMAALRLWADDVADFQTVDKTWMGMVDSKYAPFVFNDIVGLNTAYNVASMLAEQNDDPVLAKAARKLKEDYIDKGKLGVVSGEGFYKYPNPAFMEPDFLK